MDYKSLWDRLSTDISANLEFAELVVKEEPANSRFFWEIYSIPILKWIAITVYSGKPIEDVVHLIMAQYYLFVSSPFIDNRPHYSQLTTYKGLNDLKLESWLKRNGKQYFVKQVKKETAIINDETELIEFIDYETLLSLENEDTCLSDEEQLNRDSLIAAWDLLSEKDKDVLHILVIQKLYWVDAYEELNQYIFPKEGRQVMESWDNKTKQNALARMKARAIEHLIVRFNNVKRKLR